MKKSATVRLGLASTALVGGVLLFAVPAAAQSLPDTGNVSVTTTGLSGGAPGSTNPTFATSGAAGAQTLTVNLQDNRTILNWGGNGFDIATGNTVDFKDVRATAGVNGRTDNIAVLNRDVSGVASNILGTLKSDPNVAVFLINSSGIVFGPSSITNTGSFFASTPDLADTNFLTTPNTLNFSGNGASIVLKPGARITTTATESRDGGPMGDLVLIGKSVFGNETGSLRTLTANGGSLALIAASAVTVQSAPGSPLSFSISGPAQEFFQQVLVDVNADISGKNVTIATLKRIGGNSGQSITLNGSVTATGAAVTDRGVVLTAALDAPGVTFASLGTSDSGAMQINSKVTSAKNIVVKYGGSYIEIRSDWLATGLIDFNVNGMNGYASTITGGQVILPLSMGINGKITVNNGDLTFRSLSGNALGSVSLGGGANVSGNIIANTGDFNAGDLVAGGSINIAAGDLSLRSVTAGGPVSLAGFRTTFTGDVKSDGDIRVTADRALVGNKFTAAGSLYLQGVSSLKATDVSGLNGVSLITDGYQGASSIFDNGRLRIGTVSTGTNSDLYIRALQLFDTNDNRAGSLSAGRNVEVHVPFIDAASITGHSGSVKLFATGSSPTYGSYVRVDNVVAGTSLSAVSPGTVTISNASAGTGDIDVTSTANAVVLGLTNAASNVSAGGNIRVAAGSSSALIRSNMIAGGSIEISGPSISLGTNGFLGTQIKAAGAINLNANTSLVQGSGNVLVQSNSDGIGIEALTIAAATSINFGTGTTLLGGTDRQSDIRIRNAGDSSVALANVSARSLLGATGTDPFTNGLIRNAGMAFRGSINLVNSFVAQGPSLTFAIGAPITVTAGDIDVRSASTLSISTAFIASGDIGVRTSAGNLTIGSTGSFTGRDFVLSTPGAFLNNGGAGIMRASGQWVVYSANPAGNTFGGLDSGNTAIWGSTLATRAPSSVSGNRYVFALRPTLTFSTQNLSKVYGTDLTGSSALPFTVAGYQPGIAGAFLGDTAATAWSGAPLIGSAGLAERASVAGGPYATMIAQGSLASGSGYAFALSAPGLVTVTPKDLTGTVTANTKTYDGTTTGSGSVSLAGVLTGDKVSTGGTTFTFADKNAGTGKTVTVAGTTLTGSEAGNYTLSIPATVMADILKAMLTGTVAANNKTYDGTTTGSGSVKLNGVLAGDSVGTGGTTFTFADKNAGTAKTVNIGSTALTGADADNYTLSIPATALADILKAALTGSVIANSKTYDGTVASSGSVSLSGVVAGDSVGTAGTTFTFLDKNAAMGKTVNVSGTTLTGADAGNYTLTVPASALADILKATLTGTVTANGKTYDGTTTGSGSVKLNGVLAGDSVGTGGTTFTFADKNAGTAKTVNIGGTTLTGADAGNYTLSIPATALADILKASLTASVVANTKTYDGSTNASGSVTLNGVVAGDSVGAVGTTFTFSDKNAGTGKTVNIGGTTLTGADAGNYSLTVPATALANILKAALTGTVVVNNKTYDGTTATSGTVTLSGVIAGDTVGTTGATFAFADKNAGTGKTVGITGTTLSGADAGNYTLTLPATALADILRRVLGVTADDASKVQGASDPTLTYKVSAGSLVAGDSLSGLLSRIAGEGAGSYAITIGSLSAGNNYTLTFTPGTFTINNAPVTIPQEPLRALTLPSQIRAPAVSGENEVSIDVKSVCGDDKGCVVK